MTEESINVRVHVELHMQYFLQYLPALSWLVSCNDADSACVYTTHVYTVLMRYLRPSKKIWHAFTK